MPPPVLRSRVRSVPQCLSVRHFGPIRRAEIRFGSLTVLVGPQATGKSIVLQLLKLLVDTAQVKYEFRRAGVDWRDDFHVFLDVYFGEGMRRLISKRTQVALGGMKPGLDARGGGVWRPSEQWQDLAGWVANQKPRKQEKLFFIPAQRVLTLREGWPQAFTHYDPGVPYTVRAFSEELRLLMNDVNGDETLFPVPKRLKSEYRELLKQHLFPGFDLKIDSQRAQKRLVLSAGEDKTAPLPFMVWSAGQREFVPLLLGLYHLLVSAKTPRRKGVEWVVIEELEMGLHPRAISVVMLMVFELMQRGYKVCVSTHSPQVLEAVWALKQLREAGRDGRALLNVFDAPQTAAMTKMAEEVLRKEVRVHYFDRDGATHDISSLDPDAEAGSEQGWGGLAEFSGRANEEVARAVANAGRFRA